MLKTFCHKIFSSCRISLLVLIHVSDSFYFILLSCCIFHHMSISKNNDLIDVSFLPFLHDKGFQLELQLRNFWNLQLPWRDILSFCFFFLNLPNSIAFFWEWDLPGAVVRGRKKKTVNGNISMRVPNAVCWPGCFSSIHFSLLQHPHKIFWQFPLYKWGYQAF